MEKFYPIKLVTLSGVEIPFRRKLGLVIDVISTKVEKPGLMSLLLFCLIFTLPSCTPSIVCEQVETPLKESLLFPEFQNFPEQQFLQIKLGMELELTDDILKSNGFKIGYDEDSKYYSRISDSIEVVLPENDRTSEMIIVIKNESFMSKKDKFLSFMSKKASFIDNNGGLTILEFSNLTEPFRLNYFVQEDYIRLKIISI